jgi:hypothetical protein
MYQFFLSAPVQSEALAKRWGIDYVAICPDSFDEIGDEGADVHRLAGALRKGQIPEWLKPISKPGQVPMLYTLTTPAPHAPQ